MNAAMLNQSMDDMDMAVGIRLGGGRIPVAEMARAMQRSNVYHNINVNNSQVVVINTGDLAKIDAAITLSQGSDVEGVAAALKSLTETIVKSDDVEPDSKKELIELITALSEEIVRSKKKSVIMSLLVAIEERAKGLTAIVQLAAALKTPFMAFSESQSPRSTLADALPAAHDFAPEPGGSHVCVRWQSWTGLVSEWQPCSTPSPCVG
jgi:hypothetical protein